MHRVPRAIGVTLTSLRQKAVRLPAVARDGLTYPALRLQASTLQQPVEALRDLGFGELDLRALEREFEELAAGLYVELADEARTDGDAEALRRAADPTPSSRDGKKLLYLAARVQRPRVAVETGTFNGAGTSFLLAALEANGAGRLLSFDVSAARDALGIPIPAGRTPGWLVPERLRGRLELVLGDTRRTLAPRLAAEREIELFVHDSLHTTRQMLFEYRAGWRHLARGGLLVSDDVFWNPAFWMFTKRHRVPFRHTGTMGVTRKRP
jgi:predicted O-methyltransferase YrrM